MCVKAWMMLRLGFVPITFDRFVPRARYSRNVSPLEDVHANRGLFHVALNHWLSRRECSSGERHCRRNPDHWNQGLTACGDRQVFLCDVVGRCSVQALRWRLAGELL